TGPRLGDQARGVAIDGAGSVYVTGMTDSVDFPTTPGALYATPRSVANGDPSGYADAFVTKLDPAGALTYSTYLGGQRTDGGEAIAVDASGFAYVVGGTASLDFPTVNGFDTSYNFGGDAFVAVLNIAGSAVVYSTYLGGADGTNDTALGVAVLAPYVEVVGVTDSASFPTVAATQASRGGGRDAFYTELNTGTSGAASLSFSTYTGGDGSETSAVIAKGPMGFHVAGTTSSSNFPTTTGSY